MPGIDPTIALGFKQPDSTQQLSGLLNIANSVQTLQQNQQRAQQGQIDLQERQAMQGVLSDPANYTDDQGNFDLQKAQGAIMKVAPTTGTRYVTELANAHRASTQATQALNSLTAENRSQIGATLSSLPEDATPELVGKTVEALGKQYGGRIDPLVSIFKQQYETAVKQGGPQAGRAFILQSARSVLPQETQQAMATPGGVPFNTGTQSGVISTKPGTSVPPGQQFAVTQNQVAPSGQESVDTDAQGNKFVVTRTPSGAIVGTRPLQSSNPSAPGPFTIPPNESPQTYAALQDERAAAKNAATGAPVLHDVNRTIIAEANKGFSTGTLGAWTQKLASATGYQLGPNENATDYNVLGKMLERSALQAAASMGPHTNAGLEAAVRANGSLDYTPTAIKKIARLNDALVSGAELYQRGLENAISGSKDGVFAKRQFDQEWARVATPQALRLKNAVDTRDREDIDAIVKEVGGRGSKGAQALHSQLRKLIQLSGQ